MFEKPSLIEYTRCTVEICFNRTFYKGVRDYDNKAYASWDYRYFQIGLRPIWFQQFCSDWYDGHDLNYIIFCGLSIGWGRSYTYDTF